MNLANNHLNDYKTKPINYTVKLLREHGIHSFGYNFGSVEEQRPQVSIFINSFLPLILLSPFQPPILLILFPILFVFLTSPLHFLRFLTVCRSIFFFW